MRQSAAREHTVVLAVGSEKQNFCAAVNHKLFDVFEIFLVVAVAAVFVFYLHGDYVATLGLLQITDFLKESVVEVGDMTEIFGICTAQTHISVLQQPRRQTAEVPLGADVRPGSDYCIQSDILCGFEKTPNVESAAEIKFTLFRLVHIPAA